MGLCEVCGNEYDKAFRVQLSGGDAHVFDCFECAIHALAPTCAHCACTILGHGVESDGTMYCCAHCASASGVADLRDRADLSGDVAPAVAHRTRGGSGGARRAARATPAERTAVPSSTGPARQPGRDDARDRESRPERGHARD